VTMIMDLVSYFEMRWVILEFGVVYESRVFFMYVRGYLYIGYMYP
jgi:hypothetical protein